MARPCEVCARVAPERAVRKTTPPRLRRLNVEGRIVALCDEHARAASAAKPKSVAALRALFVEPEGRRSLIDRRSPLDRRVLPPRPEGRRGPGTRRA
jgi:hypothetical protein